MAKEPWRYNPSFNTVISLEGCQFGLEMDATCNVIQCKFRTTRNLVPSKPVELGKNHCPRERTYDEPAKIGRVP